MTTTLEEAFTAIADELGKPYGLMFDMQAIRAFSEMPCGGCENSPTYEDFSRLEAICETVESGLEELMRTNAEALAKVNEVIAVIEAWGLKND